MTTARQILDREMSEKKLQAAIVRAAELRGWRVYHTWNSMHSASGFPDLICLRDNRQLAVELKIEGAEPRDDQAAWLAAFRLVGAEVFIWYPHDWSGGEVDRALE